MSKVSARELAALTYHCPTCRAVPGAPCTLVKHILRWGSYRRPHPERIALALARAAPAAPPSQAIEPLDDEAVHGFFGLSYAQYLAIPRSALQSMPPRWQRRLVACLEELNDTIDWFPVDGSGYWVKLRDARGRFIADPLAEYERGRRRLPLKR